MEKIALEQSLEIMGYNWREASSAVFISALRI